MGCYLDALTDGIDLVDIRGHKLYSIPCEICGRKILRTQYSKKRSYVCDYCKGKIKKKQACLIPDVRTKRERRFDNAVKEIAKQVPDIGEYARAIKIAESRCEKFGSIPEAMVAIELVRLGYKIIPQQKLGKYHVDFLMPDEKIVIEVDGELYHREKTPRIGEIQIMLGLDWKIINIPAELIRKNIQKLSDCIKIYTN